MAVPEPKRADTIDYATALAQLYQRAGTHRGLAKTLATGFVHKLTHHLRLRPTALPMEILVAWRKKHDEASANKLQPLLRLAGELRRGELDERDLLTAARGFEDFEAEFL